VDRPRRGRAAAAALPVDHSLFFKLVRLVNLSARPFVEELSRPHRLSLNEWRAMVVLASHPGVVARDIGHATGLDKMKVSRALAGLERAGRLRRATDPDDARRQRLWLSDAGAALYRTIGRAGARREQQLFAGIDAAERAQMESTVDRLLARLGDEAD
jgi:DNA-binding MarR family transcriptional regulator